MLNARGLERHEQRTNSATQTYWAENVKEQMENGTKLF